MPEGDAVYQAAQRLHRALSGSSLVRADLRWPTLSTVDLVGETTREVVSVGKHILHRFQSGLTLHSHLKMEGRWRVVRMGTERIGAGVRALLGTDAYDAVGTRLGMLDLVATRDERTLVGHLGPDVLGPSWDADVVVATFNAQP